MNEPTNEMLASMSERDVDVLAAVGRVRAGAALEGVASEIRGDVVATLEALERVEGLGEAPSTAFATSLEASLLSAIDRARVARGSTPERAPRGWFGVGMMRLAAVLGAVVLALGGGGFAAVQASESAIPGDTLYPVKEAGEAVRVFFARGDGVTRIRLQLLARRQAELEAALRRGDGARSVMRLEMKVAASTSQLVNAARRLDAAGNPAPAIATMEAVERLHDRIDVLGAGETRPDVARTLRRMSNYLEGQERELGSVVGPSDRRPSGRFPAGATATVTPTPAPATAPTAAPTAAPRGVAPTAASDASPRDASATVVPARDAASMVTPAASTTATSTLTPAASPTRVPSDGTATPAPTRTPTPTATREASATPVPSR